MGILKKLGQLIITVILVTLFASLLLELLPGDPVEVLVPFGSDAAAGGGPGRTSTWIDRSSSATAPGSAAS